MLFVSVPDEDSSRQVRYHLWGRRSARGQRPPQELVWTAHTHTHQFDTTKDNILQKHLNFSCVLLPWRQVRSHHREDRLRQRASPDPLPTVEPAARRVVSVELTVPAPAGASQPEEAGPEPTGVTAGAMRTPEVLIDSQFKSDVCVCLSRVCVCVSAQGVCVGFQGPGLLDRLPFLPSQNPPGQQGWWGSASNLPILRTWKWKLMNQF